MMYGQHSATADDLADQGVATDRYFEHFAAFPSLELPRRNGTG